MKTKKSKGEKILKAYYKTVTASKNDSVFYTNPLCCFQASHKELYELPDFLVANKIIKYTGQSIYRVHFMNVEGNEDAMGQTYLFRHMVLEEFLKSKGLL